MTPADAAALGDLRRLVRECLAELLDDSGGAGPPAMPVAITGDDDLNAFAAHVCRLAEDAATRSAILAGTYRFSLQDPPREAGSPSDARPAARARVDEGVLTERRLAALGRQVTHVVLAAGVRVTPLAKDRARDMGLRLEREV